MGATELVASAPLAVDTNGHSRANGKRRLDLPAEPHVPCVDVGCAHVPLAHEGDDWLRAQLHATLRRARHDRHASSIRWDDQDHQVGLRRERALCLSCEFSGRREDPSDATQCFVTHAFRENHHVALLPRKQQLFCARCLDFVYPGALLALTQRTTPSQHRPRRSAPPHPHPHHAPSLRRRLMRSCARRGLVNMGNTCFMNAVLQALAHNPLVQHEYFVVRGHNTTICEQTRRHDAKTNQQEDGQTALVSVEPCMGCEMSSLLQTLFPAPRATLTARHVTSPVVPQSFMETFWASSPSFISSQQQDAHEFLVTLLNGIHKDTCPRTPVPASSDTTGKIVPTSPRFSATGQSLCDCVVHHNFAGVFSSEISCVFCDTVSSKYDPFLDITLALDTPSATPRKSGGSSSKATTTHSSPALTSLTSLLERFTYEERLKGTNQIYCKRCSRYVDAMKRLVIHRLPNLLVLHLGRFDFARKRKIMKAVSFPLRGLDLREFCSDVDTVQDLATPIARDHKSRRDAVATEGASGRSSPMTPPPVAPSRDAVYDLAAVVSHHGDSVEGGHFTAFVHSSQEPSKTSGDRDSAEDEATNSPWLHFDDSKVERVSPQTVQDAQAYMLLYVRRRLFV